MALTRDSYTCQRCGVSGQSGRKSGDLNVHHIVPYRISGSHALENLVTVCVACHKLADRPYWIESMREWQQRYGYKRLTPLEPLPTTAADIDAMRDRKPGRPRKQ